MNQKIARYQLSMRRLVLNVFNVRDKMIKNPYAIINVRVLYDGFAVAVFL